MSKKGVLDVYRNTNTDKTLGNTSKEDHYHKTAQKTEVKDLSV